MEEKFLFFFYQKDLCCVLTPLVWCIACFEIVSRLKQACWWCFLLDGSFHQLCLTNRQRVLFCISIRRMYQFKLHLKLTALSLARRTPAELTETSPNLRMGRCLQSTNQEWSCATSLAFIHLPVPFSAEISCCSRIQSDNHQEKNKKRRLEYSSAW